MQAELLPRQAQASSTSSTSPTATSTASSTSIPSTLSTAASTTSLPPFSDNAPGGQPSTTSNSASSTSTSGASQSNTPDSSSGLVNYYFVFFALILCIAALAGFLVWRKKRMITASAGRWNHPRSGRAGVSSYNAHGPGRQPWLGRWRSAEVSREEGLNEEGEAPPPYMPKSDEEPGRPDRMNSQPVDGNTHQTPAVPLQTLSREHAGFKPPDYQQHIQEVDASARDSSSAQSSSRHPT